MGILEKCFLGIISASFKMSVVIVFLMLVKCFITKKYTAKCRYYIWIIVIIGLLIPINLNTSHSIIHLPETQNMIVRENIGNNQIEHVNATATIEKLDSEILQSENQRKTSSLSIASIIWITGVFIYMLINIFNHLIFINAIKRWTYDNGEAFWVQCLEKNKKELNIRSNIELKKCKMIETPMLIGITKSKILIPTNLFSEDEIIFILKHELTHFKRKDLLYKLLILITNAVHWFNPMVYVMNKVISYECEESCDEAIMKSESISRRKLYGEMILMTMLENINQKSALSTCFCGGKKEMKKRLKNIVDTRIKKRGALVICLVAVITISSTLILGITTNEGKVNIKTQEVKEDNNLSKEVDVRKIIPKEIIAPYTIEEAKNNGDVIVYMVNDENNQNVCTNILNYDLIREFIGKSDKGINGKLRLIQYVSSEKDKKTYVDWIKEIEFDGEKFLCCEYDTSGKFNSDGKSGKYITDDNLYVYNKINISETEKTIKLTLNRGEDSSFDIVRISKDNIVVSSENVENSLKSNDFIKKIDDKSSDEEFIVKANDDLDKSFILPVE